jgi:hypothetical protein
MIAPASCFTRHGIAALMCMAAALPVHGEPGPAARPDWALSADGAHVLDFRARLAALRRGHGVERQDLHRHGRVA